MIECCIERGRVNLRARVLFMGDDMCILLDGGQKPHMGALCTVTEKETYSYTLPQHKEQELAQNIATTLHQSHKCKVTCLCGIHIPQITPHEIELVYSLADELLLQLNKKIQNFILNKY